MSYGILKSIHVCAVVISLTGFTLRGLLMLAGSPLLGARWVRIVPHVVDTLLLASALWLAALIHQYPFVHAWLTAKVLGLIASIALGVIALRRGRSRSVRATAFVLALAAAAYVVGVAIARDPASWIAIGSAA